MSRQARRMSATLLAAAGTVAVLGGGVAVVVVGVRVAARPAPWLLGVGLAVAALAGAGAAAAWMARRVRRRTVLTLDLTEPLVDPGPGDVLWRLRVGRRPTLLATVEALERAARDDRVAGLVVRIGQPATGLADIEELRDAIAAFRAAGKHATAYADTFGEFAAGNGAYYLACACDEIAVQPSGDVGLTGLVREEHFLRGALAKLGVTPRLDHRHEFKTAANVLTQTGYTAAHREASGRLVTSQFAQLVRGVAAGRALDEDRVRALVDRGPLLGPEALEAGLVDRLAYRDEVLEAVRARAGDGARLVRLAEYARRAVRPRGQTAALICVRGGVARGRSGTRLLMGTTTGADTVTAALRRAVADRRVRAVLLRVDSPGGSYVASDAIWREVVRAREAGTPVVVSMGNVAASGGYFVAMAATRVVAHPSTVTGSIGVVGGKAVLADAKDRLGVSVDAVAAGEHAGMWSWSRDYAPGEWARLQRWLDRVYDDFVAKVGEGRHLPVEQVRDVARGRVWTGADALERGLVDELGGYAAAKRAVREAAGLGADARLRLRPFPARRRLRARDRGEEGGEQAAAAGASLPRLGAAATPAAWLVGAGGGDRVLLLPDPPVRW